jgi:hypothetical protein
MINPLLFVDRLKRWKFEILSTKSETMTQIQMTETGGRRLLFWALEHWYFEKA